MSLWETVPRSVTLYGRDRAIRLAELATGFCPGDALERLRWRSVLLAASDQLVAATVLLELDGVVRHMVLCPRGVAAEHLAHIAQTAQVEAWVCDRHSEKAPQLGIALTECATPQVIRSTVHSRAPHRSAWVLLSSPDGGSADAVAHTVASLAYAFADRAPEWLRPAPGAPSTTSAATGTCKSI